jgi:hypothetical protein
MTEHAEGVGANIDAAVFLYDVMLPGLVDEFTRRIVVWLVAILLIAQPVAGGKQRPTCRSRFEGDVCEHLEQITPNRTIVLRQLSVINIIRRPDQGRDSLKSAFQCG